MLNQIILVGRITRELEVEEKENIRKGGVLTLAIPRSFKNSDGEYETDFINIRVFDSIAENVKNYCRKGDIVGIKGRIQSIVNEKENGEKEFITEIIAEKVTFLSSKSKEDE